MSEHDFHPLVKQLLDGDITLADLPAELRAEGEAALRLLAAVDRRPVELARVTHRVMDELARRPVAKRPSRWFLAPALALAAILIVWLAWPTPTVTLKSNGVVTVRFVLVAPDARQVSVAGTFNQWDPRVTPLMRTGSNGVWTATLTLPLGQHQYAFVVDGVRWVPDPAAPAVNDGFGRRNSVLTL